MLVLQVECVRFVPRTKKMDKEGEGKKAWPSVPAGIDEEYADSGPRMDIA